MVQSQGPLKLQVCSFSFLILTLDFHLDLSLTWTRTTQDFILVRSGLGLNIAGNNYSPLPHIITDYKLIKDKIQMTTKKIWQKGNMGHEMKAKFDNIYNHFRYVISITFLISDYYTTLTFVNPVVQFAS